VIKLIIVGVGCFVVALAVSTGVTVLRTPVRPAAADSTAAAHGLAPTDSVLHAAGGQPSTANGFEGTGTSGLDEFADEPADGPSAMQLAAAVPRTAEVVHTATPNAEPHATPADYPRLGKILVNMKPAEAAAILAYLADAQVEGVLRSLGPRQAAAMLASIPTERAAQLSRRLLVLPAEEKKP
jgi:hypothetical protein